MATDIRFTLEVKFHGEPILWPRRLEASEQAYHSPQCQKSPVVPRLYQGVTRIFSQTRRVGTHQEVSRFATVDFQQSWQFS